MNHHPLRAVRRALAAAGLLLSCGFPAVGADASARVEVARSVGPAGRLIRREGDAKNPWHVVADKEAVDSEDLLIGLPGAEVETTNGAVGLRLVKFFDSPLPVLEPAVTLHQDADFDLDFTLERGMVEVTNRKERGAVRVRIHARDSAWNATLEGPGDRLLVELFSGWRKGVHFHKKPRPKEEPLAEVVFLVLKGEVDLEHDARQLALAAPPGPALIAWDSATGMDESPQRLEKLPAWVLPPTDAAGQLRAKLVEEGLSRFAAEALKARSIDAPIDAFLASDKPLERRLAVLALAATDQLPRLGKALRETDHPDVWDNAVLALRHWIGRGPGQDQKLYQGMIDAKLFTPTEAAIALDLLHDFGDADLGKPETYELLIRDLDSDKLFIRGLAYWHLSRLVPEGRKFGYDPHAPQDERAAAVKRWQELIPAGQLPPAPKDEGK